jgi:hypothetical protein
MGYGLTVFLIDLSCFCLWLRGNRNENGYSVDCLIPFAIMVLEYYKAGATSFLASCLTRALGLAWV